MLTKVAPLNGLLTGANKDFTVKKASRGCTVNRATIEAAELTGLLAGANRGCTVCRAASRC